MVKAEIEADDDINSDDEWLNDVNDDETKIEAKASVTEIEALSHLTCALCERNLRVLLANEGRRRSTKRPTHRPSTRMVSP